MLQFLGRRMAAALLTLFVVSALVFFSIHMLPGDPVLMLLGDQAAATPEVVESMRQRLNLHLSPIEQYVGWLQGLARFDLGNSLQTGVPVMDELYRRVPRSLELIFAALAVAVLIGIPLGVVSGRSPDSLAGWLASAGATLSFSSPVFVLGIILIVVVSLWAGALPSSGYVPFSAGVAEHLKYLALPAFTLGLNFAGIVIRMTSASLRDVLGKDYIRMARAKGMPDRTVSYRHALPNALVPVIAVIGVRAGSLLGGTVIVEALFNWPGLSTMLIRSCYDRDYPMIQGSLFAIFFLFILISIVFEVIQAKIDPRIRQN
jgi:peptide/nickel transport system permease protein